MPYVTIPENRADTPSAAKYQPMQVLATQQISPRRSKTPEGFLLCLDVPVARVGEMVYAAGEIPVEPGRNGIINVTRDENALHNTEAVASLLGKPVTDDHPPPGTLVTPETWKALSKGVVLNPRADYLEGQAVILCDLLITDKQTIENVEAGKVEVSAGYEADYEDNGDGTGCQTNIIFNHVALVLNGRCGPRCAIGDHQTVPSLDEELSMPKPTVHVRSTTTTVKRQSFLDRLRALTRDAEAEVGGASDTEGQGLVTEALTEGTETTGANDTHIHLHLGSGTGATMDNDMMGGGTGTGTETLNTEGTASYDEELGGGADATEARIAALETGMSEIKAMMQKLLGMQEQDLQADAEGREAVEAAVTKDSSHEGGAPVEEDKMRAATGDSAALATAYQQVLADASILVPGFRMPTFDAKATRAATIDSMCATRRRALDIFSATEEGAAIVKSVNADVLPDLGKLDCKATAVLFNASAGAKKLLNNRAATADASRLPREAKLEVPEGGVVGAFTTIQQLNEFNKQFYGPKS